MAIEVVNQDVTTKEGWDAFVEERKRRIAELCTEPLGIAIAHVVMTSDMFTGKKLERSELFLLATRFSAPNPEAKKQDFADLLSAVCFATDAIAILFMSEAWTSRSTPGTAPVRPSEDPAREETIILAYDHVTFGSGLELAAVHDTAPRVREWDRSMVLFESRFINKMLRQTYSDAAMMKLAARAFIRSVAEREDATFGFFDKKPA